MPVSYGRVFGRASRRAKISGVSHHLMCHTFTVGHGSSTFANGRRVWRMADALNDRAVRAPPHVSHRLHTPLTGYYLVRRIDASLHLNIRAKSSLKHLAICVVTRHIRTNVQAYQALYRKQGSHPSRNRSKKDPLVGLDCTGPNLGKAFIVPCLRRGTQ